jgi:hypothetical protein
MQGNPQYGSCGRFNGRAADLAIALGAVSISNRKQSALGGNGQEKG